MAPAPSSCVTCCRKFAENRELATIPDGDKIAFDPAHRRVWRICPSCGEWNLLGAEAAAAALPELEARFATASPSAAPELRFAPARIGPALELLRVGPIDQSGEQAPAAVALRAHVDRRKMMMRRGTWFLTALVALWLAFVAWYSHGNFRFAPLLILLYSSVSILQHITNRLRRRTTIQAAGSLLVSCAAFAVGLGLALAMHQQENLRYLAVGLVTTLPLIVALDYSRSWLGVVRVRLADGTKLRLSETEIPRVTMSWDSGGSEILLEDLPKGRVINGADVAVVFRRIYPWNQKRGLVHLAVTMNAVTENAYSLLNAVGGLHGLLRALEGFRRENDGRVLISSLPMVYLIALDLALSNDSNGTTGNEDLHQRALEAAAVADEAERLDDRSTSITKL